MPLFTPSRTKWRKWYTSIEIIHSSDTTGALLSLNRLMATVAQPMHREYE
jgi:hypothetical protein